MAKVKEDLVSAEAVEVEEVKKPYIVISGTVLAEPVGEKADRATKKLSPHKRYKKGSTVYLGEKDAKDLLKLKVVEPVK
jgi:hypothetical protein